MLKTILKKKNIDEIIMVRARFLLLYFTKTQSLKEATAAKSKSPVGLQVLIISW